MSQVDLSGITYVLPILSFLLVFVIVFAILQKSKIIEKVWLQIFTSFLLATLFISATGPTRYVDNMIPWFVMFLISLFLIFIMMGFVGKPLESLHKGIGIAFVVLVIIMFVVSAIVVFNNSLSPYLPWSSNYGSGSAGSFTNWFYSGRVMGAFLLIVVSAIVSFILVKAK